MRHILRVWKENPHLHRWPFGLTVRGGLRGMARRFFRFFREEVCHVG